MNFLTNKKILTGFLMLVLLSCDTGFLDPTNPSSISADEVWQDEKLIEMYVNRLYNDRPGWDYDLFDNISDEARGFRPGSVPDRVCRGDWDEVSNPMAFWAYDAVRRANEFLAKIDNAAIGENIKIRLKGEARFLRAFLYFDMIKRYGGVPLITEPQSLDDDLEVARNTVDEGFKFVMDELDQAIKELPLNAPRGKAGKGAAMALKGRALLFYASPLYNSGNDASRWEAAAQASREVINLGKYALYPTHSTLWLDKGANSESIFEIQYKLPEKQHGLDSKVKPLIIANNAAGISTPLQELVDAFPMKNGKHISESGSGYNPSDPYAGRDNRFYDFVGYNGSKMKGTNSGPPVREITLEIYKGGREYDANPAMQTYNTFTGYFAIKAVNPENTIYMGSGSGSDQPWIEIRYAEVLLNYAEARNESLGDPDETVYQALNEVRKRAGITTDLAAGSLTKNEMRELIRNERYIELCFEHKRYWDLRRWKIAHTHLNGKVFTAVVTTKNANGTFTYEYHPRDAQPMVFTEKMYMMPIPQSEITKNRKMEQNPGW